MQQLTAFEMENISGGTISLENLANGLLDAATFVAKEAGAGIIGAAIGALYGASFGLRWGGEGGGILGFGLIGGWVRLEELLLVVPSWGRLEFSLVGIQFLI